MKTPQNCSWQSRWGSNASSNDLLGIKSKEETKCKLMIYEGDKETLPAPFPAQRTKQQTLSHMISFIFVPLLFIFVLTIPYNNKTKPPKSVLRMYTFVDEVHTKHSCPGLLSALSSPSPLATQRMCLNQENAEHFTMLLSTFRNLICNPFVSRPLVGGLGHNR